MGATSSRPQDTTDALQFEQVLLRLLRFMSSCRDPWCIFGGAALYLHGYREIPVSDIDILITTADAAQMMVSSQVMEDVDGGTDLFRSRFLLHPQLGEIDVELMGGFEIHADGRWHPVTIKTQLALELGAATVPVASLDDTAEIFRLSGREKDLRRLTVIDELRYKTGQSETSPP